MGSVTVKGRGPGAAVRSFGPGALLSLEDLPGSRAAAKTALSRAAKSGEVMQIRRGLYYKPKMTAFGPVPPRTSDVVERIVGTESGFGPGGRTAAHQLGLTTQIPAREEYVTVRSVPTSLPPRTVVRKRNNVFRSRLRPLEIAVLEVLRDGGRTVDGGIPALGARVAELSAAGAIRKGMLAKAVACEPSVKARATWSALRLSESAA